MPASCSRSRSSFPAGQRLSSLQPILKEGSVERREDRRFHIPCIVLRPRVTIAEEVDRDRALKLIEKAEAACLIRNSVRTEITLEPTVVVEREE